MSMTLIESPSVTAGVSSEEFFHWMMDLAHLGPLMPEEYVQQFKGEGEACTFSVKGGFSFSLRRIEAEPFRKIMLESQKPSPIRFNMEIRMDEINESSCKVQVYCHAELNPFMKMMVEQPLNGIFAGIVNAVEEQFPQASAG
ncbi:MAG: hypothetical protein O2818_02770 [Bacteroidetes bacterium]|nr:hypothetical protein [Bacteroidota bacterium]MDA1335788.1 hypothetical protein [Bacteroidota bacterium]